MLVASTIMFKQPVPVAERGHLPKTTGRESPQRRSTTCAVRLTHPQSDHAGAPRWANQRPGARILRFELGKDNDYIDPGRRTLYDNEAWDADGAT